MFSDLWNNVLASSLAFQPRAPRTHARGNFALTTEKELPVHQLCPDRVDIMQDSHHRCNTNTVLTKYAPGTPWDVEQHFIKTVAINKLPD